MRHASRVLVRHSSHSRAHPGMVRAPALQVFLTVAALASESAPSGERAVMRNKWVMNEMKNSLHQRATPSESVGAVRDAQLLISLSGSQ